MGQALFGGGNQQEFNRVPIADTPEQRQQAFLDKFYTIFGGGSGPNQQIGNPNFRESLSGYYGGAPFQDIANQFSKVNTFQPRAKPQNGYRLVPSGGNGGGGISDWIPDPLDTIAPGAGYFSRGLF